MYTQYVGALSCFYMFAIAHKHRRGIFSECCKQIAFRLDCLSPSADDWVISNKELTEKTKYTITGLSPGCKILVRVKALNAAGASAPRTLQHSILVKEVVGEL